MKTIRHKMQTEEIKSYLGLQIYTFVLFCMLFIEKCKLVKDVEKNGDYEKEKASHGPWAKLEGDDDDDDEGPAHWIKQRAWGTRGGGCAGKGLGGVGGGSQGVPGFAMQVCGDFGREGVKCYLDGPESSLES